MDECMIDCFGVPITSLKKNLFCIKRVKQNPVSFEWICTYTYLMKIGSGEEWRTSCRSCKENLSYNSCFACDCNRVWWIIALTPFKATTTRRRWWHVRNQTLSAINCFVVKNNIQSFFSSWWAENEDLDPGTFKFTKSALIVWIMSNIFYIILIPLEKKLLLGLTLSDDDLAN